MGCAGRLVSDAVSVLDNGCGACEDSVKEMFLWRLEMVLVIDIMSVEGAVASSKAWVGSGCISAGHWVVMPSLYM